MNRIFCFLSLFCLLIATPVFSQPMWSVGGRIGYTFGDRGGFTWGLEASYLPRDKDYVYGYTLDLTFWPKHTALHAGVEGWYGAGLDIGPTLFWSDYFYPGFSAIVWDGFVLYGYYELAVPFSDAIAHSVGLYLKMPADGNNIVPDK